MEAVAADAVFLKILMRNRIHISFLRHSHTKGSIPYSYVWLSGHSLLAGLDTHQVCRVVQRSKVEALADHTLYVIIHNNGIAVYHTAVKYAVADRRNLICVCDHAMVCILQSFHNKADRYGMIWHRLLKHELVLALWLVGQLGSVNTDTLAKALCDYVFIFHIDQLVL